VNVIEEKGVSSPPPTNYGNVPLDVSQSGSTAPDGKRPGSKFEEHGKKFGKKMGNAGMLIITPLRMCLRSLTLS
jgi:hypothetical protein